MAVELATAYISLVPSMRGARGVVKREMDAEARTAGASAGDQMGRTMGGSLGGSLKRYVTPLLAGLGVAAVAGFANRSVEEFAKVEDATAAASTIFGSSMGSIIQQSQTAATQLGLSRAQVVDAANTFGTFGRAAGLSGDDLAGFSTKMTSLAGDMASFRGTSPEQAIEAIGAALRGESEPIRQYGVLLDDATLKARAMALGIYEGTGALTPQQKVLAAQAEILAQTSLAQGDFARTQDSTANVAKTTAARFLNLKAALGEQLAPAFTFMREKAGDAIGFITERVIPGVKGLFDLFAKGDFTADFGRAFGLEEDSQAVNVLFNLRDAAMSAGDFITGTLVPALQSAGQWIVRNRDWLLPLATMILSAVAAYKAYVQVMAIWKGVQAAAIGLQLAWNAAMMANPIGLIVAAIAALVAGLIWAYNNVDWFRNAVDAAFAWVKMAIGAVADWWTDTVVPAWNAGYDAIAGVVQTVSDAIGAAWEWIRNAASSAWDFIYTWVLLPWRIQFAVAQRVFEVVSQAIGAAWEWIRSAAQTAWEWIDTYALAPLKLGIRLAGEAFEWAYENLIEPAWRGIRSAAETAWNWIRDNVFPPFERAVDAIGTTFERVSEAIGTAWEKIKEAAAAPVRFVVNTVYNDGIRRVVQNVLDALGVDFTLPTASLSFASGGVLPGYTPGSDVHHFWSPTGGALHLSGGEGIIRPDALRALGGASWLNAVNAGRGQSFAEGGIWEALGGAVSGAVSFLTDPAAAVRRLVEGPLGALQQITGGPWGQAMAAIPAKIVGGIVAKAQALIASMFSSSSDGVYTGALGGWRRPSRGPITSGYGPRNGGFHNGVDFGGNLQVYAANTGMVVATGNAVGYGNTGLGVRISHGGGLESYYGHADPGEILVRAGQIVAAGQHISWGGNTGNSTGQHLHFSLFQNGRSINPMVFDSGGMLPTGVSVVENRTGKPEPLARMDLPGGRDSLADLLEGVTVTLEDTADVLARSFAAKLRLRMSQGV